MQLKENILIKLPPIPLALQQMTFLTANQDTIIYSEILYPDLKQKIPV